MGQRGDFVIRSGPARMKNFVMRYGLRRRISLSAIGKGAKSLTIVQNYPNFLSKLATTFIIHYPTPKRDSLTRFLDFHFFH
jgi:hypothetical protein